MPKNLVTTEEVSQAILQRITTGHYAPGVRMPSVRDLAEQLHSNRNTVNKAYQMLLDLGVIERNASGRLGFSVSRTQRGSPDDGTSLVDYFYQQAVNLVWQGMAVGVTAQEMLGQVTNAIADVYRLGEVKMIFFECNPIDSEEMGSNLNRALGRHVDFNLLDELYRNVPAVVDRYDLIITTFHHLAEIIQALRPYGTVTKKVIGIDTRPNAETMLRIARLAYPKIGIVATIDNTAQMLKHIIFSYHPDREIEAATTDDLEQVRILAENSQHLVVTHTCAEEVQALTGKAPDVIVDFQIDEQSVAYLKQRIYEIQVEKTSPLKALTV